MNNQLLRAITLILLAGCASSSGRKDAVESNPLVGAHSVWNKKLPGLVTDLDLVRNTGALLVTTIPNYEEEEGSREFRSVLFSPEGKELFTLIQPQRVRQQSVASDGSLFVFANYEDEIVAFSSDGKRLWSLEAHCRPRVLGLIRKVLCYHDDDVKPGVAFEVIDWDGARGPVYRISGDALALESSRDEQSLVLGLTGGRVQLVDWKFRRVWEKRIAGEVIDVAVSNGITPRVFVLSLDRSKRSRITVFSAKGVVESTISADSRVFQQIAASPEGDGLFALGNSASGQLLSYYHRAGAAPLGLVWEREEPRQADFSPPLVVGDQAVLFGSATETRDSERLTKLAGFSSEGALLWTIPVATEEGAYLFVQRTEKDGRDWIAVASDGGELRAYRTDAAPTRIPQAPASPPPTQ